MPDASTNAVNDERRKMVKNLHGGLSQRLMGATMLSHLIMGRMEKEGNACTGEMEQLDRYLKEAVEDLQALYKTLEPTLNLPVGESD